VSFGGDDSQSCEGDGLEPYCIPDSLPRQGAACLLAGLYDARIAAILSPLVKLSLRTKGVGSIQNIMQSYFFCLLHKILAYRILSSPSAMLDSTKTTVKLTICLKKNGIIFFKKSRTL
jgi:hypothetical protein